MTASSPTARAPLTWTDWPARRQPWRAGLAGSIILLTVIAIVPSQPWLAAMGTFILLSATAEVLLPARYVVGPSGACVRRLWMHQAVSLNDVSGVEVYPDRLVLTARAVRPWLARRRSLTLHAPPASLRTPLLTWLRSGGDPTP